LVFFFLFGIESGIIHYTSNVYDIRMQTTQQQQPFPH
jgi:hypothetical protein